MPDQTIDLTTTNDILTRCLDVLERMDTRIQNIERDVADIAAFGSSPDGNGTEQDNGTGRIVEELQALRQDVRNTGGGVDP